MSALAPTNPRTVRMVSSRRCLPDVVLPERCALTSTMRHSGRKAKGLEFSRIVSLRPTCGNG